VFYAHLTERTTRLFRTFTWHVYVMLVESIDPVEWVTLAAAVEEILGDLRKEWKLSGRRGRFCMCCGGWKRVDGTMGRGKDRGSR